MVSYDLRVLMAEAKREELVREAAKYRLASLAKRSEPNVATQSRSIRSVLAALSLLLRPRKIA